MRCYTCGGPHPSYDCRRAREIGYTARPLVRRYGQPCWPPPAEYLEAKAKLKVATGDGELDPRRLHGPDLARWQVAVSRAERGEDVDAWLARLQGGGRGAAAA